MYSARKGWEVRRSSSVSLTLLPSKNSMGSEDNMRNVVEMVRSGETTANKVASIFEVSPTTPKGRLSAQAKCIFQFH